MQVTPNSIARRVKWHTGNRAGNGRNNEACRRTGGHPWYWKEVGEYHLSYPVFDRLQKLSFSSVRSSDLTNMGLIRKPLRLNNPSLDDRKYSHITDKHVDDLCIQITRIRRTASKRVSPYGTSLLIL